MADVWGDSWGGSWGVSWAQAEAPVEVPRKGAGKSKRRRYQLPDGLHVYGTEEEVSVLLRSVEPEAPEPVFVKRLGRPKVVAEGRPVIREVVQQSKPSIPDPIVAFSQMADLEAIAIETMLAKLRRRRMAALLLL